MAMRANAKGKRMLTRRVFSAGLATAAIAPWVQTSAWAQAYPNRPVRVVLPFAAGGVADVTARIVADKLGEKLGQRFVVENQPGPGGIAAARAVLTSPVDGHTLAMLTNGTAVSVPLFKSLPFDPLKEFTPISTLGLFDLVVVTNAETKFGTLADFLKAAREQPGKLNVGTIGVGSTQNLRPSCSRPRRAWTSRSFRSARRRTRFWRCYATTCRSSSTSMRGCARGSRTTS